MSYASSVSKNTNEFQVAGSRKRKTQNVVKGSCVDSTHKSLTYEKEVYFCIAGFHSGVTEDQVSSLVKEKVATLHNVSLIKNRFENYKSHKMFKVTVGANDIPAMLDRLNWHRNLSIRRFFMPRSHYEKSGVVLVDPISNNVASLVPTSNMYSGESLVNSKVSNVSAKNVSEESESMEIPNISSSEINEVILEKEKI